MFRSALVVIALVSFVASAVLLSVAAMVRARTPAARADAAGVGLIATVLAGVGLGWAPVAVLPLGGCLIVAFLWFAGRAALHLAVPSPGAGDALGTSVYHSLAASLGGWVLFSAAGGGGSITDHPAHGLGLILLDVLAGIVMVFASAGWLLATFTLRSGSGQKPVPGLIGIREALVAAGLAVALYAVS